MKLLNSFAHHVRVKYTVTHLREVVQTVREPLSDFLSRYIRAVMLIPDITPSTAVFALVQNLLHEDFRNHLIRKTPSTLLEALAEVQPFIQLNNVWDPRTNRGDTRQESRQPKRLRQEQSSTLQQQNNPYSAQRYQPNRIPFNTTKAD